MNNSFIFDQAKVLKVLLRFEHANIYMATGEALLQLFYNYYNLFYVYFFFLKESNDCIDKMGLNKYLESNILCTISMMK